MKDGTEFLDELKDRVHDLYDENNKLKEEVKILNNIIKTLEEYVIGEQISEYGDTLEEANEYLEKLKRS